VRTGGFPCRGAGCERSFQVVDQRSMDSLRLASAERTAHELEAHAYRHVPLADEPSYRPGASNIKRPPRAP
jgi:hypothetical protein